MSRFLGLRRFMRLDRGSRGVQRAVDDELQFHFDMTVAELRARGLDEQSARNEAERRFGDVARTRNRLATIDRARVERQQRAEWWDAAAQDLRYAIRGMRLHPGFTATVVLTLGLGIGANATMFGIVDRLLFRAPPYLSAAARTHEVYFNRTRDGSESFVTSESYARFLDIARDSRAANVVVGYTSFIGAVGDGEAAREVTTVAASAGLWRLFDARPALGRFYDETDDRPGTPARVAVVSYEFWQSTLQGSPKAIGQSLRIYRTSYTIIGVTPPRFSGLTTEAPVAFVPLAPHVDDGLGPAWATSPTRYNETMLAIYARRRAGVSLDAANADLSEAYQRSYTAQAALGPVTRRFASDRPRAIAGSVIGQRGPRMSATTRIAAWLLGVSMIVLLVACANVGNLLLGRAVARRREIAVRLALGISRRRLIAQLLLESALLAVAGAGAGLVIAHWGGEVLRRVLLDQMVSGGALADRRTLWFAGVVALGSGLLSGLAPVLYATRGEIAATLQANGGRGGAARSRIRDGLLIAQAALCVVLLVGAGLFVRSVITLRATPLGYDPDALLWVQSRLRGEKLDAAQRRTLRSALVERALRNPDVVSASPIITVPFYMTVSPALFVAGSDGPKQLSAAIAQSGSADYFKTAGTRILRGRPFDAGDDAASPLVAVVSHELAHQAWGAADPIGECLHVGADTMPCRRVIGVAEDVHIIGNLAGDPDAIFYLPATQFNESTAGMYVRVRGRADQRAEAVRRDLQAVMPGAGYIVAAPVSETIAPAMRSWRVGATMFMVFGALAFVLATIGLYSVVAYAVAQRRHEMGVRVALGARTTDVMTLIVGDGMRLVFVGVALGIGGALAGGRWVAPLLFKVSPTDAGVFGAVSCTMLLVAAIASGIPARRAARVDPVAALRAD